VLSSVTVAATGSTVHLTGTAVDPDSPSAALPVRISEGDAALATAATEPATHRFDVEIVASDGPHSYTVTLGNVGEGNATSQAAPPIDVNGDPRGAVAAVTGGVGTITIDGQESDPNGQPQLAISLDGAAPIVRSVNAPDYDITLPARAGTHQVTITYLHSAGGQDVTERTGRSRSPDRGRPGTRASWSRRSPRARPCCWAWSSATSGCAEPADGCRPSVILETLPSTAQRSAIGIPPVTDIQHDDLRTRIVDRVTDAVLTAARSPMALERFSQRRADSVRVVRQWSIQELHAGGDHRLG
jgi:hypothetical protein